MVVKAAMTDAKYTIWINGYTGNIYRKCKEVTEEMQTVFPELRIVKGMVTIFESNKDYQHQWLVDIEGNIVDPTKRQWVAIIEYKEIKDGDNKPIGKCYGCGGWVYGQFYNFMYCNSNCYLKWKKEEKRDE